MSQVSRRGFLAGIIAACAAPAIIRTPGLIMPVKPTFLDSVQSRYKTGDKLKIRLPTQFSL